MCKSLSSSQFLPLILEVENNKIVAVYDYNHFDKVDYDFGSNRVLPGFIGIYIHMVLAVMILMMPQKKVYVTTKFTE